jgi:cellulase/cellobiase CelA1
VVVYIRADLEAEIAADPLAGQVGWSWLVEALDASAAGYQQASGTVTRVMTEGFGAKSGEPATTGFELRASWSPAARDDLGRHLAAWCDALCAASGLPPLPDGVLPLRASHPRRRRP